MAAERVGRYRLEQVIGAGSFATVHRATDDRLQDTVVLKVLAENHSLNPEIRERFIGEGRSLRKVQNPHVITVHDLGETDRQQPYLVLEHADRGTLAERVEQLRASGWRATRADVLTVARQLAEAVGAVHAADLVHRDLSPGNVLLGAAPTEAAEATGAAVVAADEKLVVADLGMCKDLALNSGLTVAGGTSGFRPPEQQGGPAVVDTRADLWAMSALLLWLIEGAELPDAVQNVLTRSLATDPDQRHQDVTAWLADIEAALPDQDDPAAGGAVAAGGRGGASAEAPASSESSRARRRITAAVVVLALVLALAGGVLIGRWAAVPGSSTDQASVAISGPDQVGVGEAVTFTASVEGVNSWVWTLPDGSHVLDEETVTLTARSGGSAEVVLRARAPDGTPIAAVHRVVVE